MVYKCKEGFYLIREVTKDNRFIDSRLHIKKDSIWNWIKEEADIIVCANEAIEIYLDRLYFVNHFEAVS